MLDNIRLFALAVESGSISQAAIKANLTLTTASRKLKLLEQEVGGVLFHRSKKGLKLTPLGDTYYHECAALVHALDERLVYLEQDMNRCTGPLSVLVPTNLAAGPLDLFWQQFTQRYPDIRLNVRTADPDSDMLTSGADIALRYVPVSRLTAH
ncbi:LysR family transcriptional regulator [Salinimonas lutimaris]|uniref:LysR family transcriptional regulator n=1 Tax=Salinimonas lutimaris TaxID=914153 RepID=UPI0010C07CFF|nr:LysR family transcriptional regulator [Salinimonas lutimaris]